MNRKIVAAGALMAAMLFSVIKTSATAEAEPTAPVETSAAVSDPTPSPTPVGQPEYGGLRIDMSAAGEKGSFDVLVRIGEAGAMLPVPAGTQYLFRSAGSQVWTVKRVESSGAVSLADGDTVIFTKLPAGSAFSVRETKNTLKSYSVSYSCDRLDEGGEYTAAISDDGGITSVAGTIPPEEKGTDSEICATVSVGVCNTAIEKK